MLYEVITPHATHNVVSWIVDPDSADCSGVWCRRGGGAELPGARSIAMDAMEAGSDARASKMPTAKSAPETHAA